MPDDAQLIFGREEGVSDETDGGSISAATISATVMVSLVCEVSVVLVAVSRASQARR
jgi:hypothetical protein